MKLKEDIRNAEQIFGPQTKIIERKRNDFITAPHETENYIYFVISGSAASFIEKDGEDVCVGIYTKGNFFSEYASFIDQEKSKTHSLVLQNCKLAAVHYLVLQQAYQISIDHERKGRKISEQLYKNLHNRLIDLLTLNAEERYLKFLTERPEDVLEIPLKYIASYLGMTPVSLSRIRKKISG